MIGGRSEYLGGWKFLENLINGMDFHFWFTFWANYKFMSSKFWNVIREGGIRIRARWLEKISKINYREGGREGGELDYWSVL